MAIRKAKHTARWRNALCKKVSNDGDDGTGYSHLLDDCRARFLELQEKVHSPLPDRSLVQTLWVVGGHDHYATRVFHV